MRRPAVPSTRRSAAARSSPHVLHVLTREPAAGEATVNVAATCLDALTHGLDALHVVKIDAEGAEAGIFEGMSDTLRRLRPDLVIEFNALRYPDPAGFLGKLRSAFPSMSAIDFNGDLQAVDPDRVLARTDGEDWLLFFSHRR